MRLNSAHNYRAPPSTRLPPVARVRVGSLSGEQVEELGTFLLRWAQTQPAQYRLKAIRAAANVTPKLYENPALKSVQVVYSGPSDDLKSLMRQFGIEAEVLGVELPRPYDALPPPYDALPQPDDEPLPPPDAAPGASVSLELSPRALLGGQAGMPLELDDIPPPPPLSADEMNREHDPNPAVARPGVQQGGSDLPGQLILELDFCLFEFASGKARVPNGTLTARFPALIEQISRLPDPTAQIHAYSRIFYALQNAPRANPFDSRRFARQLCREHLLPALRSVLPATQQCLSIRDELLRQLQK